MNTVAVVCTVCLLAGGLYWFFYKLVNVSFGPVNRELVQENYKQCMSFFSRPKEIQTADQVPVFVDTFYNLVTDIFERASGQSFHHAPGVAGKSHSECMRIHEQMVADLIGIKPGQKILDVGCGIGGPMREIATHAGCNVTGIVYSEYQVNRAKFHNKKQGFDKQCDVVCGNFLEMPFENESFDGAYSIESTCYAPKLEDVYGEIFRVLKPGSMYVSYEYVTTDLYRDEDPEHVEIVHGIERCDAVPGTRNWSDVGLAARKVGFEVVAEKDLAKPAAKPWWLKMKKHRKSNWKKHMMMMVVETLGIMPKATVDVFKMLAESEDYIIRGAEFGIVTPMYMILCKKPQPC